MTQTPQDVQTLRRDLDPEGVGREIYDRIRRLYPICRSITGNGLRSTLQLLGKEIPLETQEVATGTRVFDWTVPKEWNIRDAYIKDRTGRRVVDFNMSNLHVVNYSTPVEGRFRLAELRSHLHTIPEQPDWIPYKTSYYNETWGFCLSHRQLDALPDDEYDVRIDAALVDGHMTLAECFVGGRERDEVLISSHVCHPSLCNDNLSGVSIAVTLAKLLAQVSTKYSYRFLFNPGTIGAITWLALHEADASRVKHGLVLACLGDRGPIHYKRSRRGSADIDRAVAHVLAVSAEGYDVRDFTPEGYDERQYCSPGFDLPVGVLSRTPHGRFPEYHTSADNLDLIDPASLADSLEKILAVVEIVESNGSFLNRSPKCEPRLGARGLYSAMGGLSHASDLQTAMMWVLNMSDGSASLLDIANRSRLSFQIVREAAMLLMRHELLSELDAH